MTPRVRLWVLAAAVVVPTAAVAVLACTHRPPAGRPTDADDDMGDRAAGFAAERVARHLTERTGGTSARSAPNAGARTPPPAAHKPVVTRAGRSWKPLAFELAVHIVLAKARQNGEPTTSLTPPAAAPVAALPQPPTRTDPETRTLRGTSPAPLRFPVAPPPAPPPVVGVWDAALTPTGAAEPLPGSVAVFHGDGRFTLGPPAGPPSLALAYRYEAGAVVLGRAGGGDEEAFDVAWAAGRDAFSLDVPQGSLAFRRRPVAAAVRLVAARCPPGATALAVTAAVEVENAPGLPLDVRCRVFDADGRPVRAGPADLLSGPDAPLVVSAPVRPGTPRATFPEVRLAVPLADLPRGAEVRVTVGVWSPRDRREVARSPAWGMVVVPGAAP